MVSTGTRVSESKRDARSEKATVYAIWTNNKAAIPLTNASGVKTTMLVMVAAITGLLTSVAPLYEASIGGSPISMCRLIFSRTTMASSTNRPTPRASPPRVMIFSVNLPKWRSTNVAMIEMGMEWAMINVLVPLPIKMRITATAKRAPIIASC